MPDHFQMKLTLHTAEGLPVPDGKYTLNIKQNGREWRQVQNTSTGGTISAEVTLPNPPVSLSWEILCDRFQPYAGQFFMPQEDQIHSFAATLFRITGDWVPNFTALASLESQRFDLFRRVVAVSDDVDLKSGGKVGNLNEQYDAIKDSRAVFGKMALLNLHAVLTDEQDPIGKCPWFTYVRRVVRLDQERFIAEVDPTLFENVQTLIRNINTWKAQGYFLEASSCLHNGNIPSSYPMADETISIKWKYQQGNLQLTLSFIRMPERVVHVLDCDLDEHANIALHTSDIVKHDFTHGTSPIEMFDYISLHSSKKYSDGLSHCDIGYTLTYRSIVHELVHRHYVGKEVAS